VFSGVARSGVSAETTGFLRYIADAECVQKAIGRGEDKNDNTLKNK
jgi:hypothetical protein